MFIEAEVNPNNFWNELKDNERFDFAVDYLSHSQLSIGDLLNSTNYSHDDILDFCRDYLNQNTPLYKAINK